MNPNTVLYILDLLAAVEVRVWLDGGWGVDALLGRITRPHNDLDLIFGIDDLARVVEVLVHNSFEIKEEEVGRVVLAYPGYGIIDLHPVRFDHGNAVQVQPAESPVIYPKGSLVSGWILGREVGCISAEVQVFTRLGRDPSEKHREDMIALCARFGLEIPSSWNQM